MLMLFFLPAYLFTDLRGGGGVHGFDFLEMA